MSPRDSWKFQPKWTLPSGGGGKPPAVWPAGRSAFISQNRRECPVGTPFFVLSDGLAAWGKGLPSASRLRAGHVPPAPPACGPTPCPPCAAAVPPPAPSSPLRGLAGEMWRPRPRLRRVLVKLAASRCAGAPLRNARPSPYGAGRWPGLALLLPRAGRGAGAPGRPGPHKWGLWGRPPLRPGRRRSGQPCQPGHACGAGRAARLCLRTRRPA